MVTVQLWGGVVLLIVGGLLSAYICQELVRGRSFAERHSEGATKAFLELIRWAWAVLAAMFGWLCFLGAFWLVKFVLSQSFTGVGLHGDAMLELTIVSNAIRRAPPCEYVCPWNRSVSHDERSS